jgi:TolA-binding protein
VQLAAKWTLLSTVVVGGGVTAIEVAPRVLSEDAVESVAEPTRATRDANALRERSASHSATNAEQAPSEQHAIEQSDTQAVMAPTNNPSPQEQLALEVALLDDGRLALARGEFARTANLAERYLATYPSGRLEQEARYLRMQAERALGNQRDAERDARRLLELNPNGPHARAARKVLE